MINHVTIPEALEYKEKLKAVDGVTEVTWLDDAVDITLPISAIDNDILETYYADNTALLTVTIEKKAGSVQWLIFGRLSVMKMQCPGSAVSTATHTLNTVSEIQKLQ